MPKGYAFSNELIPIKESLFYRDFFVLLLIKIGCKVMNAPNFINYLQNNVISYTIKILCLNLL